MSTVPAHMFKDVVADSIVRKGYFPSLSLAYQVIEKFKDSYLFCLDKDVHPDECADDIYYEWVNHCRTPVKISSVGPLDPRICKKVVKL